MFGGKTTPERPQSQAASLPPLDSPYLVNASSRSISFAKSSSPNERTYMYKLQEQLKTLQDEIQRKDKLIDQMSKLELKTCPDKFLESKLEPNRSMCLEREEVAALNVKLENLRSQLLEATNEIHQKETITESLKAMNGDLKEEIARLQAALGNTSKEMNDFNDAKDAFETIRQRNNILINNLQDELNETQQQLMESRVLTKQLEDQLYEVSMMKDEYQKQIQDLKSSIYEVTCEDIYSLAEIVNKMKTLMFEKETSSNKILALEEKLKSRDCEQQASRQTITRLVAKLSTEETKNATYEENVASLKREIDQFTASKSMVECDINSYECQIASLKKEIEIMTQDNNVKTKRIEELSANFRINHQNEEQQHQINKFINSLVTLLSENYKTPSNDSLSIFEWIIGCIRSLLQSRESVVNRPLSPMNDTIDSLKSDLLEKEKNNSINSWETESHIKVKLDDLAMRLKNAEKELVHNSVVIDGLNCDKTKYFRILSELARVMNMDDINKDIGFDMISEALYARACQLQKLEYDAKTDHRLTEHSLTRKVKELKEKIHSKDLHIDLLHKKLTAYEGKQHNYDVIGKERDKELSSNKKLAKHNQKLQEEIENLRSEIVELKAVLLNNGKLQVSALAQEQEIKSLIAKLDKLESVRQKQSKILNEYKMSKNTMDKEVNEIKENADRAIASLNYELQSVNEALGASRRKEQQMIEMRSVIAKLLGLDIDTLAIPDFEIINRLERLITAHHSNVYTQYAMEATLQDMNQGLFHEPCIVHSHHSHITSEKPIYPKSTGHS